MLEPVPPQQPENAPDSAKAEGFNIPSAPGRVVKYAISKALMILITIVLGVFVTVLIVNQGGQIDQIADQEVLMQLNEQVPGWSYINMSAAPTEQRRMDAMKWDLDESAGLHLSYWPRNLRWTFKALSLDWRLPAQVTSPPGSAYPSQQVKDILLTDLPHTLLLVGLAFFLLFVTGIPLSLTLFRKQGSWLDRLVTLLAPISSVPSWVILVLLLLVFAVNLRLFPPGGMLDSIPANNAWERILMIARHAFLPVLAIFLSLIFQFVNTWRTYFLLYSEEDYVTLAIAKGLPDNLLEERYILRPSLPYILTSFTLTLVSFWQMTMALEKINNWPGIGRLYILTLPNFWGESFYPGVASITLGIVVLFAWILGLTIFLLDLLYGLVDPRIRLGSRQTLKAVEPRAEFKLPRLRKPSFPAQTESIKKTPATVLKQIQNSARELTAQTTTQTIRAVFKEILGYPSAVFGLVIITLLVCGSAFAMIAFPYDKLGDLWYSKAMTGKVIVPRLAQPAWINWFNAQSQPETLRLTSTEAGVEKSVTDTPSGKLLTLTYTINFPYSEFPQDLLLYFDTHFESKAPFASLTWLTPDGRKLNLGGAAAGSGARYDAAQDLPTRRLLLDNPLFKRWYQGSGNYPTSRVMLLFADPAQEKARVLRGKYQLRVDGVTFDQAATLDAELIVIGQVYGLAGTDFMRRDLIVPLLWGMPFALIFGLLGALVTSLIAMLLAAAAAWYGGWLDVLVQQLIEANMILPVIAISVMLYSYLNFSIWTLLTIIVILNVFSSPAKSFRAAFLQVKEAPYIEAARAYGASDARIILKYMIPRILPVLIPQLVTLIPSYVFLEATLGIFNVKSDYPTWGRVIYEALRFGGSFGSSYWVIEPLALLLLTGLAFSMLGFALERVLNPVLKKR